ncbi:glucan endo-1,3-beta-glucosidase 7-like isoform X2 [Phalaenopsis equestris]|nr:glucan endo-1,3-beta-glucosidase 7-like isoform X2 [Phalaenopsis equestris]XP_020576389.1 glucan endo-1,3-beta-glucosidase 7-like isoform X2 [Phalaenopsis equestris]XP_020576390.1 glucan endo-1,3-beta-glucosidase 7-like isoform X2 [Phalaenopsis equestris]
MATVIGLCLRVKLLQSFPPHFKVDIHVTPGSHANEESGSQSFIGVNYGQVADNLPSPTSTIQLLRSTTITKLRLYGADPAILRSLAGTQISAVIGAANGEIASLAGDPSAASRWVASNVLPFLPSTSISSISVGNEVLSFGDPSIISQLLPAMQNLRSALIASSSPSAAAIKVTSVHSMAILAQSEPPSAGAFHSDIAPTLQAVLDFLNRTGSPFMINPYPFFAYRSDPRPETLSFCLFQPNPGRFDAGSKLTYSNMFDAQVDAVRSALNSAGYPAVEIVVAETGWPYRGDPNEVGTTVDNARAFNGNLIAHLRSMVGTPLMPGKSVETYIFALYDEDLKPGPTSERSFGLFRPDLTMTYDAGLKEAAAAPAAAALGGWCVPKEGVTEEELQENLDFACGQEGVDCSSIQPGGACFEPNTVKSHATYAMNQLFQVSGRNAWNCDFRQSAMLTAQNPSYGGCVFPVGGS